MTATFPRIEHGTYRGYQQCRKGGDPCGRCREALNTYHRAWRASNPNKCARHAQTQSARDRALRRLAIMHPADMRYLYRQELHKLETEENQ